MKKFITPVSMKCTQEQYERDLKKPLEELGYKWDSEFDYSDNIVGLNTICEYLTNFYNRDYNSLANEYSVCDECFLIDHYNPELFLALAAMTEGEDWIVGEYLVHYGGENATNKIFKVCDLYGCNSSLGYAANYNKHFYRKATKEELINHFTKEKNKETMETLIFTPEQQREVYQMACTTWKPKIQKVFADTLFANENHELSEETFKEWLEASTPEQKEVFKQMQPDYFKESEVFYEIGMRFKHCGVEEYILAQTKKDVVCLISLRGGNRWENPVEVKDFKKITQQEFDKITDNQSKDFTLVK